VDIDPAAVGSARRNVETAGGDVYLGDLYQPLPWSMRGRIDILVANAPYVPTDEIGMMPPEARLYEPLVALDGGADGLELHRRVADAAPQWLAPGGHLLIETSERQAPTTADIVGRAGLCARVEGSDDLSATIVIGTWR
jgi:release factor glutamine methyltransferase